MPHAIFSKEAWGKGGTTICKRHFADRHKNYFLSFTITMGELEGKRLFPYHAIASE
jgi:hypothetical protein